MTSFEQLFGCAPESVGEAPGRVNMLGEHTDYNGGFVLPTTIPQRAVVSLAESRDGLMRVESAQFPGHGASSPRDLPPRGFARYVYGCWQALRERGHPLPPLSVYVDSTVPIGSGLSSSAALSVATLRALRARYRLHVDDVELARIAQEAEVRYAGVHCGIMDQMAASLGAPGRMLFLDTRSLEYSSIPLPVNSDICVLDSGTPRSLAITAYNERRRECERAAHLLGVGLLREVTEVSPAAKLPPPLERRVRHVVTENARVLTAARGTSAAEFGRLMNASHASLKDDFEVSVPSLDALVECLQAHPAVYGARLTGAGFGGACVALVRQGSQAPVATDALAAYASCGYRGRRLVE